MEELIQEKVTQKENELNATYDEKMRNYEERFVFSSIPIVSAMHLTQPFREKDLQKQVALTKGQLRDLRMSNESSQAKLLDHTQRQGTLHGDPTSDVPRMPHIESNLISAFLQTKKSSRSSQSSI